MKILELIRELPELYADRTTIHLLGAPGIGKSSLSKQVADILAAKTGVPFGYVDVVMPTVDAPDIRGFLVPTKDEMGVATSYYTKSPIIQQIEDTGLDHGVLMLDEFLQAEMLTAKAAAQIILDHKIGEWDIPEGWWVMMASNRAKDKSGANRMMSHIINRLITLEVDSDIESWAVWASNEGAHPMTMAFAKSRPGVIFTDEVPSKDEPFATPRSYWRAMQYLTRKAGEDKDGNANMFLPNDPISNEIVTGYIGTGAASELFAFLKVADIIPTIEDMLKSPDKCKLPPGSRLDGAFAVSAMISHYVTAKNVDKLWTVCERLPVELQTSTALTMLQSSGGALLNSKSLNDWISRNRTLISNSMGN